MDTAVFTLTWASALVVFVFCLRELELLKYRGSAVSYVSKAAWWTFAALASGCVLMSPIVPALPSSWAHSWQFAALMLGMCVYCVVRVHQHIEERNATRSPF